MPMFFILAVTNLKTVFAANEPVCHHSSESFEQHMYPCGDDTNVYVQTENLGLFKILEPGTL